MYLPNTSTGLAELQTFLVCLQNKFIKFFLKYGCDVFQVREFFTRLYIIGTESKIEVKDIHKTRREEMKLFILEAKRSYHTVAKYE